MRQTAEIVLRHQATLGEGALWNEKDQFLYWVDIMEQQVMIFDPATGDNRAISTGSDVGTVVQRESGGAMIAVRDGFASLDLETGAVEMVAEQKVDGVRFNDGKCDPQGRFWAGTMAYDSTEGAGSLYLIDADFSVRTMIESVSISNGLVWTSDRQTFYYIDSPTHQVQAFDYDDVTGDISNHRIAIEIDGEEYGAPDGMTIDSDDNIWVAMWGGGSVTHWNPQTGELLGQIEVPGAKQVTSCALGGPELNELFITTASIDLDEEALQEQVNAGILFKTEVDAKGVSPFTFRG